MRALRAGWILSVLMVAAATLVASPREADAIGLLVPDRDGVRPFDIESHRVDVTVTNTAAVTEIEQVFRNHTDRRQEATFVFPLPEGATVSDFSLWMGGEEVEGAVLEAGEARQTYESIVRRSRDPGLVEYVDGRLFEASIFPIPPHSTKKLKLKFSQTLDRRAGLYRYTYPMHAGSKYVTAETEKDFTLTGTLQSPLPITAVYSPTHEIGTSELEDGRVRIGAEKMHEQLDRDFELYIGYSKRDIGFNLMTYDPDGGGGGDGYFMAALAPRVDLNDEQTAPQAFTFVVDTSGSMHGEKIAQARETLAFCIEHLDRRDRYNVVRFSTGVERLFGRPRRAEEAVRRDGIEFARGLEATGGTAIMGALERALKQPVPEEYVHRIVFVTDGIPTIGETDRDAILKRVESRVGANERIFPFGVGYGVDTRLVDGLANRGRGHSDYVKPDENLEAAVSALYERVSSPVLSGIEVDFGGAETYDVYPKPLPDLFRGDQIVVFGRHRAGFDGTISVSGRVAGERRTFEFDPGGEGDRSGGGAEGSGASIPSSDLAFIPELWATRKVGYLLEQIRLNGERPELREETVRLAKKFGLVTPYTSYLAVDDREMNRRRDRRRRPRSARESFGGAESSDGSTTSYDFEDDRITGDMRERSASGGADKKSRSHGPSGGGGGDDPELKLDEADPFSGGGGGGSSRSDSMTGLERGTGSEAVEAAEENQKLKHKEQIASSEGRTRRYLGGRTFVLRDGVWVQKGLEGGDDGDDGARTVEMYSERYFELAERYDLLATVASLGDEVVVELEGTTYRIVPRSK